MMIICLVLKFKRAYLKFPVSGRSIEIDRHTRAQCSHTSVGLAQARPNKYQKSDMNVIIMRQKFVSQRMYTKTAHKMNQLSNVIIIM